MFAALEIKFAFIFFPIKSNLLREASISKFCTFKKQQGMPLNCRFAAHHTAPKDENISMSLWHFQSCSLKFIGESHDIWIVCTPSETIITWKARTKSISWRKRREKGKDVLGALNNLCTPRRVKKGSGKTFMLNHFRKPRRK